MLYNIVFHKNYIIKKSNTQYVNFILLISNFILLIYTIIHINTLNIEQKMYVNNCYLLLILTIIMIIYFYIIKKYVLLYLCLYILFMTIILFIFFNTSINNQYYKYIINKLSVIYQQPAQNIYITTYLIYLLYINITNIGIYNHAYVNNTIMICSIILFIIIMLLLIYISRLGYSIEYGYVDIAYMNMECNDNSAIKMGTELILSKRYLNLFYNLLFMLFLIRIYHRYDKISILQYIFIFICIFIFNISWSFFDYWAYIICIISVILLLNNINYKIVY